MTEQPPAARQPLLVLAAGSLRLPLPLIIDDFRQRTGVRVEAGFGPSGQLRARIEAGQGCHLFASADHSHPGRLAWQGLAQEPILFAGNRICVLVRQGLSVNQDNLLPRLLDPELRLGAPPPVIDPGGDYARAFFGLAETLVPGAGQALISKTETFLGRSDVPPNLTPGQAIAAAFARDRVDAFVVYLSICREVVELVDDLALVTPPPALRVTPEFWMCLLKGAPRAALGLADHILSPVGQGLLAVSGFTPLRDLSKEDLS